ncbi:MAG: threonine/serine dehydratase [Burkholderiaceae bacterium]
MGLPLPVDRDAIDAAAARLAGHLRKTPVMSVDTPAGQVELKLEFLQLSGTFKARGAFNRLLHHAQAHDTRHVAAASGGNHGIAVALAARSLGFEATIFVPANTPPAKRELLESLGATVHARGEQYAQAFEACEQFIAGSDAILCHAYDQPETLAGQGTVAREWADQTAGLDTVLVAVGGGGLIGGMAAWFQGSPRVIAVETTGCPTLNAALAAGRPVDVEVGGIAADSLGARRLGEQVFPIVRRHVAASVLVSDDEVIAARRFAWSACRVLLEPGGATALAAWLSGRYRAGPGERVGVLLCGANTRIEAPDTVRERKKRRQH